MSTFPKLRHTIRRRIVALLPAAAAAALAVQTVIADPAAAATRDQVREIVIQEASKNPTVPVPLALAVARVESNFDDDAESSAGARGVMQIMPATARGEFGVDPDDLWDARTNVRLGVLFLERLYKQYGRRWELALSHYNGGTLEGYGGNAIPHSYTRDYVRKVSDWNARFAREFTEVQLASASGASETREARTSASRSRLALTEHPTEYWMFDEPTTDGNWRKYLEAADYWLASPEEQAEMRRKMAAAAQAGARQAQAAQSGTRAGGGAENSAAAGTEGWDSGRYEPVDGAEPVNRFDRVSPRVQRLRDSFFARIGQG